MQSITIRNLFFKVLFYLPKNNTFDIDYLSWIKKTEVHRVLQRSIRQESQRGIIVKHLLIDISYSFTFVSSIFLSLYSHKYFKRNLFNSCFPGCAVLFSGYFHMQCIFDRPKRFLLTFALNIQALSSDTY